MIDDVMSEKVTTKVFIDQRVGEMHEGKQSEHQSIETCAPKYLRSKKLSL